MNMPVILSTEMTNNFIVQCERNYMISIFTHSKSMPCYLRSLVLPS